MDCPCSCCGPADGNVQAEPHVEFKLTSPCAYLHADHLMGLSGVDSPLCLEDARDLGHQPTAQEELARRCTYPAGALLP